MNSISIRIAAKKDLEEIRTLFRDTVQTINASDYSEVQIECWSSAWKNTEGWEKIIKEQLVFVSETDEKITGFASLTKIGLVDLLYVHKDFQRMGTGKKLMEEIENKAQEWQLEKLNADVSKTALPFFLSRGFIKTGVHEKKAGEVIFINNLMEKNLKK